MPGSSLPHAHVHIAFLGFDYNQEAIVLYRTLSAIRTPLTQQGRTMGYSCVRLPLCRPYAEGNLSRMNGLLQGYAVFDLPLAVRGSWPLPLGAGEGRDGGQRPRLLAPPRFTPTPTLPRLRGGRKPPSAGAENCMTLVFGLSRIARTVTGVPQWAAVSAGQAPQDGVG